MGESLNESHGESQPVVSRHSRLELARPRQREGGGWCGVGPGARFERVV